MAQIEIILTEKVGSLGSIGDIVNVKAGYAKHYLIPRKKALRANAKNKEIFLSQKEALIKASADKQLLAESQKERIDNKIFHIIKQASERGHLYGSVSIRDIMSLLKEEDITIENSQVILTSQIKELGIFAVKIALHVEVEAQIILSIARSEEESEDQVAKSKQKEDKSSSEISKEDSLKEGSSKDEGLIDRDLEKVADSSNSAKETKLANDDEAKLDQNLEKVADSSNSAKETKLANDDEAKLDQNLEKVADSSNSAKETKLANDDEAKLDQNLEPSLDSSKKNDTKETKASKKE